MSTSLIRILLLGAAVAQRAATRKAEQEALAKKAVASKTAER